MIRLTYVFYRDWVIGDSLLISRARLKSITMDMLLRVLRRLSSMRPGLQVNTGPMGLDMFRRLGILEVQRGFRYGYEEQRWDGHIFLVIDSYMCPVDHAVIIHLSDTIDLHADCETSTRY